MSAVSYRMRLFVPDGCKHKGTPVNVALSLALLVARLGALRGKMPF